MGAGIGQCAAFVPCSMQAVPRPKWRRVLARGVALVRVDENRIIWPLVLVVEVVLRSVEQKLWCRCWFGCRKVCDATLRGGGRARAWGGASWMLKSARSQACEARAVRWSIWVAPARWWRRGATGPPYLYRYLVGVFYMIIDIVYCEL